jgi:hypothetical protein
MAYSAMRYHLPEPHIHTSDASWFSPLPEHPQLTEARHRIQELTQQYNFAESQVAARESELIHREAELVEQHQQAAAAYQAQIAELQAQINQRQALDADRQAVYRQDRAHIADLQQQLRTVMPPDCSGDWGVHRQRGRWPVQTYTWPKQLALASSRWATFALLGLGLAVIVPWGWSLLLGMGPVEAMVALVPKLVGPIGTLLLGIWLWATVAEG